MVLGWQCLWPYAEDPTLKHGPFTLLITVDEEEGLTGAQKLDHAMIPDDVAVLVNLDSEENAQFICRGCAGGVDVNAIYEIDEKEELPAGYTLVDIDVKGLPGGHSGANIHEKRGNAIKILSNLLFNLRNKKGIRLINFTGGNRRNVIPSDARCTIAIDSTDFTIEDCREFVSTYLERLKRGDEDLSTENAVDLEISADESTSEATQAIKRTVASEIIGVLCHIGILKPDAEGGFMGGVMTSSNLGVLAIDESGNEIKISILVRAANPDDRDRRASEIADLFRRYQANSLEVVNEYEGWLEPRDSKAIVVAEQAVRDALGGVDPVVFAYHAGLESAVITNGMETNPNTTHGKISSVSMGPRILDAHSIKERVLLSSIADVNKVVRRFIELFE